MRIPAQIWLMVTDGTHRLLYRNHGSADAPRFESIESTAHALPHTADLGSDAPGRAFASSGTRRSAYATPDLHQRGEDDFARATALRLNALLDEGHDDTARAILVAPPRTLGMIREHLSPRARAALTAEINHDYVVYRPDELVARITALPDPG